MKRIIICLIAVFLLLPFMYGGCGGNGGGKGRIGDPHHIASHNGIFNAQHLGYLGFKHPTLLLRIIIPGFQTPFLAE